MTEAENPAPLRFDTHAGYRQAISSILSQTQNTLCILDTDLKESGLESPENIALLQHIARISFHRNTIRILVRTTRHIEQHCPRLIRFLAYFNHRANLRIMPDDSPLPECIFFLADGRHLLKRPHYSLPHGLYWTNAPTTAAADIVQFDPLWVISQPGLQGTPLGL